MSYHPENGTAHMRQPLRVPGYDPGENFEHVRTQFYGAGREPPANPWPNKPPMSGFVVDYAGYGDTVGEVMGAYSPEQLPVMSGLALNFAISDRWFASIPTQTNANRAFSICGTSLGGVDNGTPKTYDTDTVFNVINGKKSWGIYWQYDGVLSGDPHLFRGSYTTNLFPQIQKAVGGKNVINHYSLFTEALKNQSNLPAFCYLEPFWSAGKGDPLNKDDFFGIQGNDYHPPAWVGPAEAELNKLYELLVHSKQWPNMLFIVTFDEHGGTWDHEPPTPTVAPDNSPGKFDFTRLGVRVPTLLISPFIQPGTVFRAPQESKYDFDHTSFIATILKWAGIDPAAAGLGNRVAVAPTFEDVLQPVPVGTPPPSFVVPADYEKQGGGAGTWHLGGLDVPENRALLQEMPIEDLRAELERPDSVKELIDGIKVRRTPASRGTDPNSPQPNQNT
jgi:phospholipase C